MRRVHSAGESVTYQRGMSVRSPALLPGSTDKTKGTGVFDPTDPEEILFHQERANMIGATDSPAIILGKHFEKTPLGVWRHKTGRVVASAEGGDLERGIALEPLVREKYARETGRRVEYDPRAVYLPGKEFIGVHLDGDVYADDRPGPGVLEIKCPRTEGYYKIKHGAGLSEGYVIQHQKCMHVTGRKWGTFVIFDCQNWQLLHFDLDYIPEIGKWIEEKDTAFWRNYVETGREPLPHVLTQTGIDVERVKSMATEDSTILDVTDPELSKRLKVIAELEDKLAEHKGSTKDITKKLTELKSKVYKYIRSKSGDEGRDILTLHLPDWYAYYSAQKGRDTFRRKDLEASRPLDREKAVQKLALETKKTVEELEVILADCDVPWSEYVSKGKPTDKLAVAKVRK